MREKFKVFYEPSEEELSEIWSHSETMFIFDTNILLNFYHYSQETLDEFFKILKIIEDNIWIPFHVALEYQRRRIGIIRDEKDVFKQIEDKLATIEKGVRNNLSEFKLKARNPDLFDMEKQFKEDVCLLINNFKAEVEKAGKAQPSVRTHDDIRAKLDDLLEGKIGDEPEEEWVVGVATEGDIRYADKVPPGYRDVSKDKNESKAVFTYNNIKYERKFGDLIIWKQILKHLANLDTIKNVIFITDDIKEDWWEIVQSDGPKHIGARTELKSEIYRETGINSFKIYHSDDFLAAAKKYCGIPINDKAIEETEDLFNNLKFRDSLQEQLTSLQQRYAEAKNYEVLVGERLANLQASGKNFSNEDLYILNRRYSEATVKKESLRERLMNLQQQCFEAADEKELLRKRLANLQAHGDNFSSEELASLQQRYAEAADKRNLLEEQLMLVQQRYSEAANEKALLQEKMANLQAHGSNFSNEELFHLKKRYSEAVNEKALLQEKIANLENNYAEIIRRTS